MTLAEAKRALRREARARRAALAASGGGEASGKAAAHLVAHIAGLPPDAPVSAYMPLGDEIDPLPALHALHEAGRILCVPVVTAPGHPLGFRRWTPAAALVRRAYGILEPEEGPMIEPRILVVPLLAFDRAGRRLGYGGGFYDRTLSALGASGSVHAAGYAYAGQEVAAVPCEKTDMPLDAVVTEAGILLPAPLVPDRRGG